MENRISNSIPAVLAMAGQASEGAGQLGAAIPLVISTKPVIDADIRALEEKVLTYNVAKSELSRRRDVVLSCTDIGRKFLTLTRDNLKPVFGNDYNELWDVTGLVGSLGIPYSPPEVMVVLQSFRDFFSASPAREIPAIGITAERAGELAQSLRAAIADVNSQKARVEMAMLERTEKFAALQKRMRDLIAELKMRMNGVDPRWLTFGLNMPGAIATPDEVEGVVAKRTAQGDAAVKWERAARADYYHVFQRVRGVDADYMLIGSPADLDFMIEKVSPQATVDILISAVNSGGEGPRSVPVTILPLG